MCGDPREFADQSLRDAWREWMVARVVSLSGDVQRAQVQVKWKPCWRCCWRVAMGSRGEVSGMVY